ncbi:MAG TPA: 2-oxoglutarate dehydrogenase E1 component, partial [Polyangiaceae bacterium]|nr:2-oxoglutarate dehydrogenase E1 component [Polyangiaceae bacterium]
TRIDIGRLGSLMGKLTELPADFKAHKKVERLLALRREMSRGERPLDWGAAEQLACATLTTSGVRIRFTGQDSSRGTFSHRHTRFYDAEDGHAYMPLSHLSPDQAVVEIYNSPLSEAGVLGFEYGYSLDWPDCLVVWEAQFGDFVNTAQVIIDQFITSAEDKWKRLSGLVMLLPHGFEGQGPEHSSARLERFLVLAAEENIQIAQPTTPAQHFHLLRRQVLRPWRKPLVVFTPKSLLRHPRAVSTLEECATSNFQRVIPDRDVDGRQVKRVLMCTGKIYYELLAHREKEGRDDVAIVRIEQLYPLPDSHIKDALQSFAADVPVVWVQDEPENMGAWRHFRARFGGK